jgi:hypothetical protein
VRFIRFAVVSAFLTLTACTGGTATESDTADRPAVDGTTLKESNELSLNEGSWQTGDDGFQVGERGRVAVSGSGCVYLEPADGIAVDIVWPQGYSLRGSASRFAVLDSQGRVVGELGRRVTAGGVPNLKGTKLTCSVTHRQNFFVIQSDLPVIS